MRLSLITLKRRPDSEDVSRRETMLEADVFRVGRGSDMDVNLPDVNVAYHHATLSAGPGGLRLEGVGGALIESGGKMVDSVALRPGESCRVGAYEIGCEAPGAHADAAITLARVEAQARAYRTPQRIADTLPSRRRLSWLLALAALVLFIAWPLSVILLREAPSPDAVVVNAMVAPEKAEERAGSVATLVALGTSLAEGTEPPPAPLFTPMETLWLSGPMSNVHAGLAENCSACHLRPFEMTTNEACLACHAETANHFDVAKHASAADDPSLARCAACHKEHVGGESPIEEASSTCTDCHANLKAVASATELYDVSDFALQHPQFRPTLVTGVGTAVDGALLPTVARAPLDPKYPLSEQSGLKFPHDVHLNKEGVRGLGRVADKTWQMNCESCHQPQADGALMRPIEMERDCGYCHELVFKPDNLDVLRELPHAKPVEVQEIVHDYYGARVLEGGLNVPGAPESARRRPGEAIGLAGRAEGLDWAAEQAELELKRIMEVSLCGDCHVAQASAEPDSRGRTVWTVQGALLQRHWMPKSYFNHEPHFAMDCVSCHAATTSKSSTDVLMPPIENCRDCHKGEQAGASASSECLACHVFHADPYGPMSPPHGQAMVDRRNAAERSTVVRATQ